MYILTWLNRAYGAFCNHISPIKHDFILKRHRSSYQHCVVINRCSSERSIKLETIQSDYISVVVCKSEIIHGKKSYAKCKW